MKELHHVSPGGIEIYGIKNPSQHGFYISLFLRTGSMYELEGECGITHFLEHILIRNVNRLMGDTLYAELDKHGMELNAGTYAEMVQFYVSGADKNIELGERIITRLLDRIVLTAEDVDAERARIKAEIRESGDRTSLATFSAGIVHEGTTLSRPITGTCGSVSKIGVKKLEEYRRRVFTKENIFFYLTGNFTNEDVERLARLADSYGLSSGKVYGNLAPIPRSYAKRGGRAYIKNADFTAVRFTFDLDMQRLSLPETDLLYDALISGYNSRFFIEMSEKRGMFYDVGGALERYKNIGTMHFTFEVRPDTLYEAVAATVDILNDLKAKALTEQECMRAGYVDNAYMLYDDYRELNFTFSYDNHIMGANYEGLEARKLAYASVTPERLCEAAREIFVPNNLTFTMKGNKSKVDIGKIEKLLGKLK